MYVWGSAGDPLSFIGIFVSSYHLVHLHHFTLAHTPFSTGRHGIPPRCYPEPVIFTHTNISSASNRPKLLQQNSCLKIKAGQHRHKCPLTTFQKLPEISVLFTMSIQVNGAPKAKPMATNYDDYRCIDQKKNTRSSSTILRMLKFHYGAAGRRDDILWVQLQWRGKCFALMNNYHLRTILSLPLLHLQNSFSDLKVWTYLWAKICLIIKGKHAQYTDDLALKEKLTPTNRLLDF